MVNKIKKELLKMTKQELSAYLAVVQQLKLDHTRIPNTKKLSNFKNIYRIRIGRYRLIYKLVECSPLIIRLTKRDDKTYKNL